MICSIIRRLKKPIWALDTAPETLLLEENDTIMNRFCCLLTSVVFFTLFLFHLFLPLPCTAAEPLKKDCWFDYAGMTSFYGNSGWTKVGPDPTDDYEWYSTSAVLGKNLTPYLSMETHLGGGYMKTEHHSNTPTIEFRLKWHLHYKWFYFNFGGGALFATAPKNIPDLAEENYFAILEGDTGLKFCFDSEDKITPSELRIGYCVSHISSPIKEGEEGDNGWNVGAVHFSLFWYF